MKITLNFLFRLISKDNEKICNRQGRPFLSKKFKDWEKLVKHYAHSQYCGNPLFEGNLEISLVAFYTNKTHPDTVNLFKGCCDALQEVIYKNDRQIKKATVAIFEDATQDSFQVTIQEM